jgi:hypothetical protein
METNKIDSRNLKAYKCIFPNFFNEEYNEKMWNDTDEFQVIYGKSQKEAVFNICNTDENYPYYELKKSIRTRRFKEEDLYNQVKSELLINLSEKEINHLTHSLGVIIGDVLPKEFYRNYSVYNEKHVTCEKLISLGLMGNYQKFENEVYFVTEIGKEAVSTLLLTKKI